MVVPGSTGARRVMNPMTTDDREALEAFNGFARLFPLPNLVHFPGVDQGLHIFEHRYRQMTADAIASDHLVALVLLKPDWEADYDAKPSIEGVACLGRMMDVEKLDDGRYNYRLRGLARIRIEAEVDAPGKLYRIARSTVIVESPISDIQESKRLRAALRETTLARFEAGGRAHKQVAALFESESPLGQVCDMLGYGLPLPLELKQRMLGEADVAARVELLNEALKWRPKPADAFPPTFSAN
jgi:Lon protease-like protein